MAKFSVTPSFPSQARMSWPDESNKNGFRLYSFDCRFKAISNEPEAKATLKKKQDDEGLYAFLKEVLVSVVLPPTIEPVDDDDQPMEPLEWVKCNAFAGAAASIAFWNVVNRDVEAKNSQQRR